MDVKYLNYILAIADRKNMTKAAEDLFVSQSSLSQYLSRLEQELGTPLFIRTKGELTLTPAGKLYVEAARKVIKIQQELYQNIASINYRGHIRVGVTSNFGMRMLSETIPRFNKKFPEVSIEISEVGLPALKKMFLEEKIDLGVAADLNTALFGDQYRILRKEKVLFAVPANHPYALEHPEDTLVLDALIKNFGQENLVLSKQGSSLRALSDQLFESCKFTPKSFVETNNIAATRRMVANNAGVAFIAESCSIGRKMIKYYSLLPTLYRLNVLYISKDWRRHEPEELFLSYLTGYFSVHTEEPYIAEYDPAIPSAGANL